MLFEITYVFSPQAGGGFPVTSPVLSTLITEGETADRARDSAVAASP